MPTDQGMLDEHDREAATKSESSVSNPESKADSPESMIRTASASPVLKAPSPAVLGNRGSLETSKPDGIIRFQSTVVVEGETRSPSDLNGNEEQKLTKRAKEIHGTLPM